MCRRAVPWAFFLWPRHYLVVDRLRGVGKSMIPTIEWQGKRVRMLDQRKLPARVEWLCCKDDKDVIRAIRSMVIRGAPAIGVAAAMGLALGAEAIKPTPTTPLSFDSERWPTGWRRPGLRP